MHLTFGEDTMRLRARIPVFAAMLTTAIAPASPSARAADRELVETGRTLAQAHCARCHAVSRADKSPRAEAPAFRRLHERYPIASLSESFAEGIVVGHADMPAFTFEPPEIAALLAYITTLGEPRTRRR